MVVPGFCFSRHALSDLEKLVQGYDKAKRYNMQMEFLDAVLSKLEQNESMDDALSFARREWDL